MRTGLAQMTAGARIAIGCALLLVTLTGRAAAAQFDPAHRFRTLPTPHFVIYFHESEDRLASRLAAIAEETWRALVRPLGVLPPKLTRVVLVDQTELSNGYATPFPRDTVVIYAVWPAGSDYLKTDDWLRLVFTHEFTHIVHLDRSEGWARPLRALFGRVPIAFPNSFLPTWQIEGIATYEESAITGEGRLHAGDFRAIVTAAARARALEPIDRVNGGLTTWPAGSAAYAYGAGFHAYLAERYGADSLAALAEKTARRLPWLGAGAFEDIYGRSLDRLWRDYEDALRDAAASMPAGDAPDRLTHHGFVVTGPRFVNGSCAACPSEIVYSAEDADAFPALYRIAIDGGSPRRIAMRYLGSTFGAAAGYIYFDQQELRNNVGLYSDLYVLDRANGRVRRLTRGARLVDPDVSPDGKTLVAAQNRAGARDLVLVQLTLASEGPRPINSSAITVIASEPETQFNAPRWSPDGRSVAVERHRPGAQTEIVLVDAITRVVRVVAADSTARWVTPAWRPDGRAIVAAADFDGESFNLYEIDLDRTDVRPLTHVSGGATWPDVSPDGGTLIYAGYTTYGFDVFRAPYAAPSVADVHRTAVSGTSQAPVNTAGNPAMAGAHQYSPWGTLRPTSWWPILDVTNEQMRLGATTSGSDVLGYHNYAASAAWPLVVPANTPAFGKAAPDWQVSHVYARWRAAVFVSASRETSFFAGPAANDGTPSTTVQRERLVETGIIFPVTRVRLTQTARVSVLKAADTLSDPVRLLDVDRSAARLAWSMASAHVYGNSISAEGGAVAGVTMELVRRALGASADATTVTGDGRVYVPGFGAHHVLALRASGGTSSGDREVQRTFLLGGAGPEADPAAFSSDAFSLLRGFPAASFAGSHAALVNADYRWPIARVERGLGAWPFFVHTIHAALFVDAGHAWTRAFAAREIKTSIGAELSARIVVGYRLPLTATVGAAWGHDGRHVLADRATVFVRVGHAF